MMTTVQFIPEDMLDLARKNLFNSALLNPGDFILKNSVQLPI